MGLMQEGLRRTLGTGEVRNALHPANLNPSEIKTNRLPIAKHGLEVKIREISRMLSVEQKEGKEAKNLQPQETSKNGFEPFVNPKPSDDPLFINGYNGNFAQKMELNRKGIERVLKIAHLDGKVFLTTLSPNRQRSIEANPDGSVSAKRFRFFGQKTEDEKDNPLSKVIAVPQGWKIEINDGKILEDLNEKGLTGEKRQKTFIKKFSQLLNQSLFECILKEKMTGIKDVHFGRKVFFSAFNPGIQLSIWTPALLRLDSFAITWFTSQYFAMNAFINLVVLHGKRQMEYLEAILRMSDSKYNTNDSAYIGRKLDARWEYLMPEVEIDKVARSWAFLSLKGRKLVREANLNI